jgi:Cdc6-like AAA superfamily ATPase
VSIKALQQEIVSTMKTWQELENATVAITAQAMEKTRNPIVRLVMEVIQGDSQMHYRVQEWISDSLEGKTVSLTPEEIGEIWDIIERHVELEKKSVELADKALTSLKGKSMVVQTYLLNYLLEDEQKHVNLLGSLDSIKKKMYPYG